jgi:hypothetical protein
MLKSSALTRIAAPSMHPQAAFLHLPLGRPAVALPDSQLLLCSNEGISIWETGHGECVYAVTVPHVRAACAAPGGRVVAAGEDSLLVFQPPGRTLERAMTYKRLGFGPVACLCATSDGRVAVAGGAADKGVVVTLDESLRKVEKTWQTEGRIVGLWPLSNGRLATATSEGCISIHVGDSTQELFRGPGRGPRQCGDRTVLLELPDGSLLVGTSETATLWRPGADQHSWSSNPLPHLERHFPVGRLADGRLLWAKLGATGLDAGLFVSSPRMECWKPVLPATNAGSLRQAAVLTQGLVVATHGTSTQGTTVIDLGAGQ